MGTISLPTTFVDGTIPTASQFNGDFNAIVNEANGNLDNTNIKASAGIAVSKLAAGTDGQVLITSGTTPTWGSGINTDGWTSAGETWTYASASTFTVSGDQTTKYTKGTRLKFTQTTAKYAVVVSSSYGAPNTTVTIAVNTDYTIANAAITLPYYSYQVSPQGYPTWFAYTPTYAGFSVDPTIPFFFKIDADICTVTQNQGTGADGTSNATNFTLTVPVAAKYTMYNADVVPVKDSGSNQTVMGHLQTSAASATVTVGKTFYNGSWTNSGGKNCYISNFSYRMN